MFARSISPAGWIASCCGFSALACGQQLAPPATAALPPSIVVSAEATIEAQPDQAELDVGVVTEAPTAAAAAQENARRVDAVLRALRPALEGGAQLRTVGYSLSPRYDVPKEGGTPSISGYVASNTVRVTDAPVRSVGPLIDAATGAGANQIQRIEFGLKDDQAVRSQAAREAAVRARADALAAAVGVRPVRILSVVENVATDGPVREVMMARMQDSAATPIEPGTIEVSSTVTLTVEVASR